MSKWDDKIYEGLAKEVEKLRKLRYDAAREGALKMLNLVSNVVSYGEDEDTVADLQASIGALSVDQIALEVANG